MSRDSTTWTMEVRHAGLNKYRVIRGPEQRVVEERASALSAQWDAEWERHCDVEKRRVTRLNVLETRESQKRQAVEQTDAAVSELTSLSSILVDGVSVDCRVNWDSLKDRSQFPERKPSNDRVVVRAPSPPDQTAYKYKLRLGLLEFFSKKRKRAAIMSAAKLYEDDQANWSKQAAKVEAANELSRVEHANALAAWNTRLSEFLATQAAQHRSVDDRAKAAAEGDEAGVTELIDLALGQSRYPEYMNVNYDLDYSSVTKSCVIDYDLPAPTALPSLKEVRFVQAREEFSEKHLSDSERAKLYDSVIYQIALRTLYVVFAADERHFVDRITFNGWVEYVNLSTGIDERSCILSVAANRATFDQIDLGRVDPRECFKTLKGVAASKLIGLAPVAPLERPRLVDRRFIESRDVASNVDAGANIAAMDWHDFEHLVRQVFESEFASEAGEVRVTQASRDGGVDAIVFNPDPIRGGKIVIQAKRYTNTVDVSAVRDLYGTVVNEGASKGILVTTSQFGPDARKFAQGKPITLIDGGNFLFLLEKMGIKARIDLQEAKSLLANTRIN